MTVNARILYTSNKHEMTKLFRLVNDSWHYTDEVVMTAWFKPQKIRIQDIPEGKHTKEGVYRRLNFG